MDSIDVTRSDFDRIARLPEPAWDHNNHYHSYLLRHVPAHARDALDVGCGHGDFSRRLAEHVASVWGIDLSPEMIQRAREESATDGSIRYDVANVLEWDWPVERFDCIASIATIHHLPFEETLHQMRRSLRAGGVLLILDLYQAQGVGDMLNSVLARPVSMALNLWRNGWLRPPAVVHEAWAAHSQNDSFLTLREIRRICERILPGARVKKHLLWRYSIVWRKDYSETDDGIGVS